MQFDLCWFDVDGWYFGRTNGILGNMNNEIYDDDVYEVAEQQTPKWALNECKQQTYDTEKNVSLEVLNVCDGFFKSKLSYFVPCFPHVDPAPFYEMCLDLSVNSYANMDKH